MKRAKRGAAWVRERIEGKTGRFNRSSSTKKGGKEIEKRLETASGRESRIPRKERRLLRETRESEEEEKRKIDEILEWGT